MIIKYGDATLSNAINYLKRTSRVRTCLRCNTTDLFTSVFYLRAMSRGTPRPWSLIHVLKLHRLCFFVWQKRAIRKFMRQMPR